MTAATTTTTSTPTTLAPTPGEFLLPWIRSGLEGLWLLAALLVPLTFLNQGYAISEAEISYVEVPKVALLRTLAGLMAILWVSDWAIKSQAFQGTLTPGSFNAFAMQLRPSNVVSTLNDWLKVHPTRWFLLAAGLFFGSTLVSTVLSGSFTTSMWGEIPGQDGYSAYTIASYFTLFGVIATHLKTPAQFGRLLGTVVLMGFLVGLYGNLQHYGRDFLAVTEVTGGGSGRVTVFMGNTIFAGAVLAMTVPATLVAAAIHLRDEDSGYLWPLSKLGQLGNPGRDSIITSLWASILAVQLLGLMFTFSRGPWSGAMLASTVFLGLVVISLGWRTLIRIGMVLGLGGIFSVAFLHWQGSVSIVGVGPWLGFLLVIMGLASVFATLYFMQRFGRVILLIMAVGAAVAVVGVAILAPSVFSGRAGDDNTAELSTAGQVGERITSIKTDVLGGFVGGRGTHWKVSWELIKNRPWFEFDNLQFAWLRPLIGYGPDLFRYTYLLESPTEEVGLRPFEPDHAHNFFIHQTVEQGIFGGLASLAIFLSVFGIAGHQLLKRRNYGNPVYRLILLGMMAIILGRFLEMMVGVARISDLTVLWVIFGLFAASASLDAGHQGEADHSVPPALERSSRRNRRRAARASAMRSFNTGTIFRLAVLAWLVGGIGVVTWQNSINSVRAAVAEGQAIEHFQKGNLDGALVELDKAIKLAPGVPSYYNNRALIFLNYQLRPGVFTEVGCDQQTKLPYLVCLGIQSLESNLEAVNQQPFNYRARIASGNSYFNLGLHESAIAAYSNAASMVPNSWRIWNELANSQIELGQYDQAIVHLDRSLGITGDSAESSQALVFKGKALSRLGRADDALRSIKRGLSLNYTQMGLDIVRDINTDLGVTIDLGYFDALISEDPNDAVAFLNRGLAHLSFGNFQQASLDLEQATSLGLNLVEAQAHSAYIRFKNGDLRDYGNFAEILVSAPQNALLQAYYGEFEMARDNLAKALNHSNNANKLDLNIGLPYLVRSEIFVFLGLEESARQALVSSVDLELPTAEHHVGRAEILASIGEYDLAFSDLAKAIQINPNRAQSFNSRAKVYATIGDFNSALADIDVAVQLDPSDGKYFVNRGVINELLGNGEVSFSDFEMAESLGALNIPKPDERNAAFFDVYTESAPTEPDSRLLNILQAETEILLNPESSSGVVPFEQSNRMALEILGQTYLDTDNWAEASKSFSQLIDLYPTEPELFRKRGDAKLALKLNIDAIADYQQAVSLGPLDSANLVARGKGYAANGDYDLARFDFTAAIQLDPTSSDAYKLRGFLSVQTRDFAMAYPDIDHALGISPLDHDAYFRRAQASTGLGRTALALADLDRAISLAPVIPDHYRSRGILNFGLANYALAVEDFSNAIDIRDSYGSINPQNSTVFVDLGRAYLMLREFHLAQNEAHRAIAILKGAVDRPEWEQVKSSLIQHLADAHELLGDAYSRIASQASLAADTRKKYQDKAQEEYQQVSRLR